MFVFGDAPPGGSCQVGRKHKFLPCHKFLPKSSEISHILQCRIIVERNFQVYFSRVLSVLVSNPVENNKYSHVIVIVTSADPVIVTLAGT